MPLSLIVGPPNSGRAGEVQRRLAASLDRDPVLVVPTLDDADRFERELCDASGAAVGASIRTFRRLIDDVAAATGAPTRPLLSPIQRLELVRGAIGGVDLSVLAASARRRGFAAAAERLIGELQRALVGPVELANAAEELDGGAYEAELALLYAAYLERRERAGRDDPHSATALATAGLRERPEAWGGRPVFVYGFDDLTEEQLELVNALAGACEVTAAVNYADREALKARADLLARLREELGAPDSPELPFDQDYTASATLRHLDQHLFEPGAPRVEPDDGLALLECAGDRGEAEAIGGEIARLIFDGVVPDDILVVLRNPDGRGPLFREVLGRLGIPVAVEATVPLTRTAVGRGLGALARASLPTGMAEDVLAFMRARPGAPPGIADWLERRIRRGEVTSAEEAISDWRAPPPLLGALREAEGTAWLRMLASAARDLAEDGHAREEPVEARRPAGDGKPTVPFEPLELRAAAAAAAAISELAALDAIPGCAAPSPVEAIEALDHVTVPLWRGSTEGRVRVLSPYRARAARARHLFIASLQDGEFPGARAADPLLGEERRGRLGIAALNRIDPAVEERYLFHASASRPTERLWLCWRSSDEDGRPAARSPFVDDVLDLLAPTPAVAEERLTEVRGLDRVVFSPSDAPSERELARAIAANDAPVPADLPGPLAEPAVLAHLAERDPIGTGTLERWIECPYRWFVDHELRPQRLEPEPEQLTVGSVVHAVLERLYREPPGDDRIPRPGDIGRWRKRAAELLAEEASERGLDAERPLARIAMARMRAQIERLLAREADSETDLRPALVEASFGEQEDADRPPLDLGGFRIHGQIDRVDTTPDGAFGVVYDYKTGSRAWAAAKLGDEGKLQPQVYGRAIRDLWQIEPIGGLYYPLGATGDPRPRGFVADGVAGTDALDLVGTDRLTQDEVAETVEDGVGTARVKAAAMRAGKIDRDPNGGRCPPWCRFQPICRLERSIGTEDTAGNGDSKASGT
jgi:hypothetical protein